MLRIENLHSGYGEIAVLHGLSLAAQAGEIITVLGANGVGKSTLLRTITGLVPATSGKVWLHDQLLTGLPANEIVEHGLIMVPEGRRLFPFMSVQENLELGSYARRARSRRRQNLDRIFGLFPRLAERRDQMGGSLSGGEQQMCAIGRGLMACPEVLLLDEPSLGLAPKIVREIFDFIVQLRKEGLTILLVEQHVKNALAAADRGFVLEGGRISVEGSRAELLANSSLKRAYMGSA
jgi:branched-chain amino acid transport system ATP-binding protein